MMTTIWIALFGGVGVACRYLIELQIGHWTPSVFPFSTFVINCTGSLLIGIFYVLGYEAALISKEFATMLTVGLLGGFTTFSAFSMQTFQLIEGGNIFVAATYFLSSPILGLLCAIGGTYFARIFCGSY